MYCRYAVATMLDLIRRCFPQQAQSDAWREVIQRLVPSSGHDLAREPELLRSIRDRNNAVLGLA